MTANILQKLRSNPYSPYLLFIGLALIMLGTALAPGYLFLLDMPWPEQFDLANYRDNGTPSHYPITVLLAGLSYVLPSWLMQKLLLISILTAAGAGMYRLSKYLWQPLRYSLIAGAIAIVNPFVAQRLHSGQWLVLAGYAYAAFILVELLKLLARPTRKQAIIVALMYAVYPIISLHFWYMMTPIFAVLIAVHVYKSQSRPSVQTILLGLLGTASLTAIVNSYWLVSINDPSSRLRTIDTSHFTAFQTVAQDGAGLELSVASLYGFWNNRFDLHDTSNWIFYGVACWLLVFIGIHALYFARKKSSNNQQLSPAARSVIQSLGVTIAAFIPIYFVISLGYGHPIGEPVIEAARRLPGFEGMRETAKYVGVLALFVALLAPIGLRIVLSRASSVLHRRITIIAIAYIAISALLPLTFGATGQITSHYYPASYSEVRNIVEDIDTPILALPWSNYVSLPFANNAYAANPASIAFNASVDTAQITTNSLLDTHTASDKLILGTVNDTWISDMKRLGYTHILIQKVDSWANYRSLLQNNQVEILYDSPEISLIRI